MGSRVCGMFNDMCSSLSLVDVYVNLFLAISSTLLNPDSVQQPTSSLMFSRLSKCTMHCLSLRSINDFRVDIFSCFSLTGCSMLNTVELKLIRNINYPAPDKLVNILLDKKESNEALKFVINTYPFRWHNSLTTVT